MMINNNDIDNDNDTCLYPTTVYPEITHLCAKKTFCRFASCLSSQSSSPRGQGYPVSGNLPDGKIMGPRENLGILLTK